jgi:hypothetical protein
VEQNIGDYIARIERERRGPQSSILFHLGSMKINGSGIDTKSPPLGPVVKYMAKMCVAIGAGNLGPHHIRTRIFGQFDAALLEDVVKRRPATGTVELGVRGEKLLLADDASVDPFLVERVVVAGEGPLGALLLGYVPLERSQATFELALVNLLRHRRGRPDFSCNFNRVFNQDA